MGYEIKLTPRSERETIIAKRLENAKDDGEPIYDFRGGTLVPKVISLPIDLPVYRMENCRTFSAQQTEIATESLDQDFFLKGQEQSSAQQAQHTILARLAKQGSGSVTPIIKELDKVGQRETILITCTGVVVNGNRRLAGMRELHKEKVGKPDQRFANVRCAVLPSDVTPDEIDDIEADLQARPQTKLDYDWIGDARLIRRQIEKGRTSKDVADRLRRSKQDIENVVQALEEADLYLREWVQKPGHYDLVSADGQQIFGDIPKAVAGKEPGLQDASRAIAWSLFENRDRISGRVYALNAAFGKLAPTVLNILSDELELPDTDADEDIDDDDFSVDIEADDQASKYSAIISALKNEEIKDEAVSVLLDACEAAIEREKGKKSAKAALKALSQANAKLMGVDANSAGENTLTPMLKQIEAIRVQLKKIEGAVNKRLGNLPSESENAE